MSKPTREQLLAVEHLYQAFQRVEATFAEAPRTGPLWHAYPFSFSIEEMPTALWEWAQDLRQQHADSKACFGCHECDFRGWALFDTGSNLEVERCDNCESFPDDHTAGLKAAPVLSKALHLLDRHTTGNDQ